MAIGAVICDAGITAILTSIISNKDYQAGTNNRMIQCSQRFMETYFIDKDLQKRVFDFHAYNNNELKNICEEEILHDLSASLRNETLRYFSFNSLRSAYLLNDLSDGAIMTLINTLKPYLAIPGEKICEIGRKCDRVYVLQRGLMKYIDSSGSQGLLSLNTIIGHASTLATADEVGLPTKRLCINLSAQSIKTKYGNLYVVLNVGPFSARSEVKKKKEWKEQIFLNLPKDHISYLEVSIKCCQKGHFHTTVGFAKIHFGKTPTVVKCVETRDAQGKKMGLLEISLKYGSLQKNELPHTHELTVEAESYCHLYQLKNFKIDQLRKFLTTSIEKKLHDRLLVTFFDHDNYCIDKNRIKHGCKYQKCSVLNSLDSTDLNQSCSQENVDGIFTGDVEGGVENKEAKNEGIIMNRSQKLINSQKYQGKRIKPSKIVPMNENMDEVAKNQNDRYNLNVSESNAININRTSSSRIKYSVSNSMIMEETLKDRGELAKVIRRTPDDDSQLDQLSEQNRSWDYLVDFSSNDLKSGSESRCRTVNSSIEHSSEESCIISSFIN